MNDPAAQLMLMDAIRFLYFVRESFLESGLDSYSAIVDQWELLYERSGDMQLRPLARQALDLLQYIRQAPLWEMLILDEIVPKLREALKADPPLVHILEHGHTRCGLVTPASEWPDGESWLRPSELGQLKDKPDHMLCPGCEPISAEALQ